MQDFIGMNVLIKQARLFGSEKTTGSIVRDIHISNGRIEAIGEHLEAPEAILLQKPGMAVSPGWLDIFSHLEDPGNDHRETIETGSLAAAAGGFTDLMLLPNTLPSVDSKSQVAYLKSKSAENIVNLHPIGAVSKGLQGKELAEMYEMQAAGAVAFSDGLKPLQHAGLMLKALQYVLTNKSIILQLPDDNSIQPGGLMHEGLCSTRLGLPGKPYLSEELMVARDIELLRYTGSRLHITGISSERSVELVAKAKKQGLDISCSVTPYHLFFTDEDLQHYDTNLKVCPPIRKENDRQALLQGLREGIIDCISSHHLPRHRDEKECAFEQAEWGMSGLESVFAVVNHLLQDPEKIVDILCFQPRKIFNLTAPAIAAGEKAVLTIFNTDTDTVFDQSMIRSRSANNAFTGKKLKGKVYGIINGDKFYLNT